MTVENFTLPLTVNGKKVKATGLKWKPSKETIYRVTIPWQKFDKTLVFTLKDPANRAFHYYKHNDSEVDKLAEIIMSKLQKSSV
jgi:hypothetical protein